MNKRPHTHHQKQSIPFLHLVGPFVLQGIAWLPGRLLLHFFMHMRVRGVEHVRAAEREARKRGVGLIFACNHTSELDFSFPLISLPPTSIAFPMFYVVRENTSYATNKEFGWRRFLYGFAPFFRAWGAHPYVPKQHDYAKALPYHVLLLQLKKSVCIFPEGRFKHSPQNYRVRGGVAYLAESTGALVVPVYIHGSRGLTKKRFFTRALRLTVTYNAFFESKDFIAVDEPIPQRYKTGAEKLMNIIHTRGRAEIG